MEVELNNILERERVLDLLAGVLVLILVVVLVIVLVKVLVRLMVIFFVSGVLALITYMVTGSSLFALGVFVLSTIAITALSLR